MESLVFTLIYTSTYNNSMSELRQTEYYKDLLRNSRNQGQRVDRLEDDVIRLDSNYHILKRKVTNLLDKGFYFEAETALEELKALPEEQKQKYEFDAWDAEYLEIKLLVLRGEIDQAETLAGITFYKVLGIEGKNEGGETVIFRKELAAHRFELLLAWIETLQGKYAPSLARFKEIYEQIVISMGSRDEYALEALVGIAENYSGLEDTENALLYGREALDCYSENYSGIHPKTLVVTNNYARYLLQDGQIEEAKKYNRIAVNEWKYLKKEDFTEAKEASLTQQAILRAEEREAVAS